MQMESRYQWTLEEKTEFLRHLGISCYKIPEAIEFAAKKEIPCIELRPGAVDAPRPQLLEVLELWRGAGGRTLSIHMPDLGLDEQGFVGKEAWEKAVAFVREIRPQRITVHVPKATVNRMNHDGWKTLLDYMGETLSDLPADLAIGIENMHMTAKDPADEGRRFGYLPEECIAWAAHLSEACGREIGLHLDVGHARNNPPFCEKYPLERWYALFGTDINAYHIHQIVEREGVLHNHQPIESLREGIIQYETFLWCWWRHQISHCPLFVEVVDYEKAWESAEVFRRELSRW